MTQSTTRIGLLSDVHATVRPVREALDIFHSEGVESILCAGDIAGYGTELEETVALLIASGCRAVLGNHDLWYFESCDGDAEGPVADYLRTLPTSINLERQETALTMLHASPEDLLLGGIRLLDEAGDVIKKQEHRWCQELMDFPAEVLVVGHTHQAFARPLGETLVINRLEGHHFVESADAICDRTRNEVSLLCRGEVVAEIRKSARIFLRSMAPAWMHSRISACSLSWARSCIFTFGSKPGSTRAAW